MENVLKEKAKDNDEVNLSSILLALNRLENKVDKLINEPSLDKKKSSTEFTFTQVEDEKSHTEKSKKTIEGKPFEQGVHDCKLVHSKFFKSNSRVNTNHQRFKFSFEHESGDFVLQLRTKDAKIKKTSDIVNSKDLRAHVKVMGSKKERVVCLLEYNSNGQWKEVPNLYYTRGSFNFNDTLAVKEKDLIKDSYCSRQWTDISPKDAAQRFFEKKAFVQNLYLFTSKCDYINIENADVPYLIVTVPPETRKKLNSYAEKFLRHCQNKGWTNMTLKNSLDRFYSEYAHKYLMNSLFSFLGISIRKEMDFNLYPHGDFCDFQLGKFKHDVKYRNVSYKDDRKAYWQDRTKNIPDDTFFFYYTAVSKVKQEQLLNINGSSVCYVLNGSFNSELWYEYKIDTKIHQNGKKRSGLFVENMYDIKATLGFLVSSALFEEGIA